MQADRAILFSVHRKSHSMPSTLSHAEANKNRVMSGRRKEGRGAAEGAKVEGRSESN